MQSFACMLKEIVDLQVESSCTTARKKRERMMLVYLRRGTAPFQIELGRWKEWQGIKEFARSVRVGKLKMLFSHWLLKCPIQSHGTISGNRLLQTNTDWVATGNVTSETNR